MYFRYSIDSKGYKKLKYAMKDFLEENSQRAMLWEWSSLIRAIDRKLVAKIVIGRTEETIDILRKKFVDHYNSYDESVIRDFCDALISAKNDALREGKESAPHLTDDNLGMAVIDMFLGRYYKLL